MAADLEDGQGEGGSDYIPGWVSDGMFESWDEGS